MATLSEHIKSQPQRSMASWASDFGISRPHLYSLIDGTRAPSLPVALRIEAATNGSVSVGTWPNFAAVADALQRDATAGRDEAP